MNAPRERGQALRADEIRRVRPDLDRRTAEEVARVEAKAERVVAANARDEGEKRSFFGTIFGRGK